MTVVAELNQIINLLEAEIPASPNSLKNIRQRKQLERELRKYFQALADAFPFENLEQIYYKNVKED